MEPEGVEIVDAGVFHVKLIRSKQTDIFPSLYSFLIVLF